MKNRSKNYVTSIDPSNPADMDALNEIRKAIKIVNKNNNQPYRVVLSGRLGKNNPNAWKYGLTRHHSCVWKEDAVKFDVYVYERK